MKRMEFYAQCGERLIDVSIALENEQIEQALKEGNDQEVLRLLDTEF